MEFEIIRSAHDSWIIDNNGVRFFLLTGSESALLIDSGMTVHNARDIAAELTDLPIRLLNTHADPDHIGSNAQFETTYMHPAECVNYAGSKAGIASIVPVWDGQVIDPGDRPLEIIALPGHTPGSIAVLDRKNRVLYSGDPIQDGRIFMFGPNRNMTAYYHSLDRLRGMQEKFDWIYPSHGSLPIGKEQIEKLMAGCAEILAGRADGNAGEVFGKPITVYDIGCAAFLCEAR